MLEILEASHGGSTTIDRQLSDYDSLEKLVSDVSALTGIPAENILLFLEDGRDVKDEVLLDIWQRGGDGSQSEHPDEQLFLFNRETFYASSAETWAAQYSEDLSLPLPLNLTAISDLSQAQQPFISAYDHIQHLSSLFSAQSRSLSIAYSSLSSHLQPFLKEFQEFSEKATVELESEAKLLRSSDVDMAMLTRINVLEGLPKKREKDRDKDKDRDRDRRESLDLPESGRAMTMANYVNPKKMLQVRDSCQVSYEQHLKQFEKLANSVEELAIQSETERRAAEERSVQVMEEFSEGLGRIEMAINHLTNLFEGNSPNLSQDLMELDSAMRQDLTIITSLKNDFTLDLHIHLRQVAAFQIRITELITPLHELDANLQTKAAFPHLHRLHNLPFAYAASVIEVVRRKEFAQWLTYWTDRVSISFETLLKDEKDRRMDLRINTLSHMPFAMPALDDGLDPKVIISTDPGVDFTAATSIGQAEVDDLTHWIQNLQNDRSLQSIIVDDESDPVPIIQQGVDKLLQDLSRSSAQQDTLIKRLNSLETNGHSGGSAPQSIDNSMLKAKIAELESAEHERVRDIEELHEQRVQSMQDRQKELQDEITRLRMGLEEEIIARQALSVELGEKTREQERENDDHSEFITALQAELKQEKDRATDLGVRLQEALLDIDGLRNAERSLVGQVQNLQEDRSVLMKNQSEMEMKLKDSESEMAGLKAELESTNLQLVEMQKEKETATKGQNAESERLMRDRIAEADGDKAILEHQNLNLAKQMEDLKSEMTEKITSAKNAATRNADGLKAELSFTKAQLRELQRKETVLMDELAMAKDNAKALNEKDSHQNDMAKEAVNLVTKYYDTCQRLHVTIASSSSITGSTSIVKIRTPEPSLGSEKSEILRESVMLKSLANASTFDLNQFSELVNKTISVVKKLTKSCKHYRDQGRNKISFQSFSTGDLALFLPTRNATSRPWMAYNVSAPHHFLRVPDEKVESWKLRDSIIARITDTEESVAGGNVTSNPFGLAEGLRFFIHQVEEFDPSVRPRPSRHSTHHFSEKSLDSQLVSTSPAKVKRSKSLDVEKVVTSRIKMEEDKKEDYALLPSRESSPPTDETPAEIPKPIEPPVESPTPPAGDPAKLSPVFESFTSPPLIPELQPPAPSPPTSIPAPPPFAIRPPPNSTSSTLTQRPASRSSIISNQPNPVASIIKRGSPSFTPGSFGRPVSVASNPSSSNLASMIKKTAPSMAITTSQDGSEKMYGIRRPSSEMRRPSSELRRPSSDLRRPSIGTSMRPGSGSAFRPPSGVVSPVPPEEPLATVTTKNITGQTSRIVSSPSTETVRKVSNQTPEGDIGAPGGGENDFANLGAGSNLWTASRKRLASIVGKASPGTEEKKDQTAADLLKRFER